MKKTINIDGEDHVVTLDNPVARYPENPILSQQEVNRVWTSPSRKVITVHNAGITEFDGQTVMLFRSHLRNGISVIGKAISANGITGWEIDPEPFLKPCRETDKVTLPIEKCIKNEAGGVEDPRITKIDGTYYITYSAYHGLETDRVRVSLATTKDFKTVVRHGPVMDCDMRNVVLFPERINNHYHALFRPNDHTEQAVGGKFTRILHGVTENPVGMAWQLSKNPVMAQSGGPSSFGAKIGPGAPPLKTPHGWLNIFHGVRNTMDGNPYVLGVALHNSDDPTRVEVSNTPILFPTPADCRTRENEYVHVPNVVFCCGALRKSDGTILIYYGGNDTVMNVAFSHEDILAALCHDYPQNPLTGEPFYEI